MLLRLVFVRVAIQFGLIPLLLWALVVSLWPMSCAWFVLCHVCVSSGF